MAETWRRQGAWVVQVQHAAMQRPPPELPEEHMPALHVYGW